MEIIIFISAVGNKSSEIISETVKNRNWKVNGKWKFAVYFGGGGGRFAEFFLSLQLEKIDFIFNYKHSFSF